jgi:hypothetical protein
MLLCYYGTVVWECGMVVCDYGIRSTRQIQKFTWEWSYIYYLAVIVPWLISNSSGHVRLQFLQSFLYKYVCVEVKLTKNKFQWNMKYDCCMYLGTTTSYLFFCFFARVSEIKGVAWKSTFCKHSRIGACLCCIRSIFRATLLIVHFTSLLCRCSDLATSWHDMDSFFMINQTYIKANISRVNAVLPLVVTSSIQARFINIYVQYTPHV